MSIAQLQAELKRLSPHQKLALADYLVVEAGDALDLGDEQSAELERRHAAALAHPENLITPEEALRRVKR